MTRYGNTAHCDACGAEVVAEDSDLPEGWLYLGVETDKHMNGHCCPKCRYFGATVKFLQWSLHPNKFSVDIIGALKSTMRICDNMLQYIGDLRIQIDNNDKVRMFETLTNMENLAQMAKSNDNVAIAELKEFGK